MCSSIHISWKTIGKWKPLFSLSILLIGLLSLQSSALAQGKEGPWLFGDRHAIAFFGPMPSTYTMPNNGGGPPYLTHEYSATVSDSSHKLKFWVKLHYGSSYQAPQFINVFNALGHPMKHGELLSDRISSGSPLIVPDPGNINQYYIFYIKEGSLHFSVVDMSRNAGLGEVIPEQKNIRLGDRGRLIDQKLMAIPSCRGVWILVRDRNAAAFLSYHLTSDGIGSEPVYSYEGALPADYYGNVSASGARNGHMRASPDGKWIAVASNQEFRTPAKGGLEIFPFHPCSGSLGASILLDTVSYYGVCFSADNSKLYATAYYERTLYQFDLSLQQPSLIRASKTPIFFNPNWGLPIPHAFRMGAIKRSPSGKLFIGNNSCQYAPSFANALHVVHEPNAAGLNCQAQLNAVPLPYCSGLELPADFVLPGKPDSLILPTIGMEICFKDSFFLQAPEGGDCYLWTDGYAGRSRWIHQSGTYVVQYFDTSCRWVQQPYAIKFTPIPKVDGQLFSCPGGQSGYLSLDTANSLIQRAQWFNGNGAPIIPLVGKPHTIVDLDTGTYYLSLHSESCDTMLTFRVAPMPMPNVEFEIPSQYCSGQPLTLQSPHEAPVMQWFVDQRALEGNAPTWTPPSPGTYQIKLRAQNAEGCMDSLLQSIFVEDFRIRLSASDTVITKGAPYSLRVSANLPFEVMGWSPTHRFPDARGNEQVGIMDSTHLVKVWARTPQGCRDTTSRWLYVRPQYYLPNVFSPNGDGLNDRFGPVSWGPILYIHRFEIYNRWGERVYQYSGAGSPQWDGTQNGVPVTIGTYGYLLDVEAIDGTRTFQKGDVTLIR